MRRTLAKGGRLKAEDGENVRFLPNVTILGNYNRNSLQKSLQERVYRNIGTYDFYTIGNAIKSVIANNKHHINNPDSPEEEAIYAKYLGVEHLLPEGQRFDDIYQRSKYKPTISKDNKATYYSLPDNVKEDYFERALLRLLDKNEKSSSISYDDGIFGTSTTNIGNDEDGDYVSIYDIYDLTPGKRGKSGKDANKEWYIPFDTYPTEFYDRMYITPEIIETINKKYNKNYTINDIPKKFGGRKRKSLETI